MGIFWMVLSQAFLRSPLLLVWLIGLIVGGMLLQRRREPAFCLVAASVLELIRHLALILFVPIPMLLLDVGAVSYSQLGLIGVARGLASTLGVVVSHVLLLVAIFGFRPPPPEAD